MFKRENRLLAAANTTEIVELHVRSNFTSAISLNQFWRTAFQNEAQAAIDCSHQPLSRRVI